jgi:hypothetical protein
VAADKRHQSISYKAREGTVTSSKTAKNEGLGKMRKPNIWAIVLSDSVLLYPTIQIRITLVFTIGGLAGAEGWRMAARQLVEELNDCKYLYLREIGEPRDNELRIVVEEAVVISNDASDAGPLSAYRPIESTGSCRLFEL